MAKEEKIAWDLFDLYWTLAGLMELEITQMGFKLSYIGLKLRYTGLKVT